MIEIRVVIAEDHYLVRAGLRRALEDSDDIHVVGTASNKLFRQLMSALGKPELGRDERFRNHRKRAARRTEINAIVADWMKGRSCDAVLAARLFGSPTRIRWRPGSSSRSRSRRMPESWLQRTWT